MLRKNDGVQLQQGGAPCPGWVTAVCLGPWHRVKQVPEVGADPWQGDRLAHVLLSHMSCGHCNLYVCNCMSIFHLDSSTGNTGD